MESPVRRRADSPLRRRGETPPRRRVASPRRRSPSPGRRHRSPVQLVNCMNFSSLSILSIGVFNILVYVGRISPRRGRGSLVRKRSPLPPRRR